MSRREFPCSRYVFVLERKADASVFERSSTVRAEQLAAASKQRVDNVTESRLELAASRGGANNSPLSSDSPRWTDRSSEVGDTKVRVVCEGKRFVYLFWKRTG